MCHATDTLSANLPYGIGSLRIVRYQSLRDFVTNTISLRFTTTI
jgi:hypothetical protein